MADFLDTFTETSNQNLEDHTPDTGTAWTLVGSSGDAIVRGATDVIRCKNTTPFYYAIDPELSGADQEIEIKTVVFGSQLDSSYVCVRLVDEDNWYGWQLFGSGSSGRRLSRNVAGSITDLDSSQGVQDEWIKVLASGTTIELYEGGTGATPGTYNLIHSATGETDHQTEVSCGIRGANSHNTDWITEFRATSLDTGEQAALTGEEGVGAEGDLSPAISVSLTGNQGAGSEGTLVPVSGVDIPITGEEGIGSEGSLSPAISVPLTGEEGAGTEGSLSPAIAIPLTGEEGTGAEGSLTLSVSVPLTGEEGIGEEGSLSPAISVSLTGEEATGDVGTLVPSAGVFVALTGEEGTGAEGSLSAAISVSLTGEEGTGAEGTLTPSVGAQVALTGEEGTGSEGNLFPAISVSLTGEEGAGDVGTIVPSAAAQVALSGEEGIGAVGSLSPSVSVSLTGEAGVGAVGTIGTVVPSITIFFSDTFSEGGPTNLESHTPDLGTAWVLVSGGAGSGTVFSNELFVTAAGPGLYIHDDNGTANHNSSFRVTGSTTDLSDNYVCLRLVDSNNFIGFRTDGTNFFLDKNVAGSVSNLITSTHVVNTWIKIEATGNTIRYYEGGTGGTPVWVQVGGDQTVTDHNTEVSQGVVIGSNVSPKQWIDTYNAFELILPSLDLIDGVISTMDDTGAGGESLMDETGHGVSSIMTTGDGVFSLMDNSGAGVPSPP